MGKRKSVPDKSSQTKRSRSARVTRSQSATTTAVTAAAAVILTPNTSKPAANVVNKDWTLDDVFKEWLNGVEIANCVDDFEYLGLDLDKLFFVVQKGYNDKNLLKKDLILINSLTYKRGFSYSKVTKNLTNPSREQELKDAMNRLKVTNKKNPGNLELTLSRVSLFTPHLHPEFIFQGIEVRGRPYMYQIPKVANCGSFVGCIPKDKYHDPLYYAGLLHNIWWDTITNLSKEGALIRSVHRYNTASRNGSTLSDEIKKYYIKRWGLDEHIVTNLQWMKTLIDPYMNTTTKVAWPLIRHCVYNHPVIWGPATKAVTTTVTTAAAAILTPNTSKPTPTVTAAAALIPTPSTSTPIANVVNVDLILSDIIKKWQNDQEIANLDINKLFLEVKRGYSDMNAFKKDLILINSLTYKRGFSYSKVTNNLTNANREQELKDAMSRLKVTNKKNPGNLELTLGRLNLLAPHMHPDYLFQGVEIRGRQYMYQIPKVANCVSFVGCIPKDQYHDPLYYAGLLYNIWWDTITNPSKDGARIQSIHKYNTASRNESSLSDERKKHYIKRWGLDGEHAVTNLQWIKILIDPYMTTTTKVAWPVISHNVDNHPVIWGPNASKESMQ